MNHQQIIDDVTTFLSTDVDADIVHCECDVYCTIICIHSLDREEPGGEEDRHRTIERYYLSAYMTDELDIRVAYHYSRYTYSYHDDSDDNYWGFTCSTFSEVGQYIQPYYREWLDRNNFTVETKKIDEPPWLVDVLYRARV